MFEIVEGSILGQCLRLLRAVSESVEGSAVLGRLAAAIFSHSARGTFGMKVSETGEEVW